MRSRRLAQNSSLVVLSLLFTFLVLEIAIRILDPTPYFTDAEKNNTEHGNLSMYDHELGWKGVPSGEAEFVTRNNRVWLAHNQLGFRDIEHDESSSEKPAIVFLGDSFTWGYEVEFEEMFVNRLRGRFPGYDLYNLAHRGYGTDQAYLAFKNWQTERPVALVVLMFSENDVGDNSTDFNYAKPKPKFVVEQDELVLTGVPVPREEAWQRPTEDVPLESARDRFSNFVYRSHLVNHVRIRLKLLRQRWHARQVEAPPSAPHRENEQTAQGRTPDFMLTGRILSALKDEVANRGAKLVVVFIPSKQEIESSGDHTPYQLAIAEVCKRLGLDYLDLAPALKKTLLRTYYMQGMHWNSRGHGLAAEALEHYLQQHLAM